MCNDYRLLADATTLFAGFSETKIKICFSEGKPNLEAREDIKITDTAPIVRTVDGAPQAARWCSGVELAGPEREARLQLPLGRPRIRLRPLLDPGRRVLRVYRARGQKEEAEGQVAVHEDERALVLHRWNLAGRQGCWRGLHDVDDAAWPRHRALPWSADCHSRSRGPGRLARSVGFSEDDLEAASGRHSRRRPGGLTLSFACLCVGAHEQKDEPPSDSCSYEVTMLPHRLEAACAARSFTSVRRF